MHGSFADSISTANFCPCATGGPPWVDTSGEGEVLDLRNGRCDETQQEDNMALQNTSRAAKNGRFRLVEPAHPSIVLLSEGDILVL
jgi:hypothetical protein